MFNRVEKKKKNRLLILIKFDESLIELPASLITMGLVVLMLLIFITPWSLLIAFPIILVFISGIIMEKITLDYESNLPEKSAEIDIFEEE